MENSGLPPIPSHLPVEILCAIFTAIDRNEAEKSQIVSKKWLQIIKNHTNILPLRKFRELNIIPLVPRGYDVELVVDDEEMFIITKVMKPTEKFFVENNKNGIKNCYRMPKEKLLESCIFEKCHLPQLDSEILQFLQHLRFCNGKKIRALNFDPGNLAIGVSKLDAYKEVFEDLITVEKLAYIRFMNNELQSFLYEPKNLYIPNPPRKIHLNFDISNHPEAFANFLTNEEIFGADRYCLRVEKPVQEDKFWEQLVDKYLACENPHLLIRNCEFHCSRRFMPKEISRKFLEKRKIPCQIEKEDKSTSHIYAVELAHNWKLEMKFTRKRRSLEDINNLERNEVEKNDPKLMEKEKDKMRKKKLNSSKTVRFCDYIWNIRTKKIPQIPVEIFYDVIQFLNPIEAGKSQLVSHSWHSAILQGFYILPLPKLQEFTYVNEKRMWNYKLFPYKRYPNLKETRIGILSGSIDVQFLQEIESINQRIGRKKLKVEIACFIFKDDTNCEKNVKEAMVKAIGSVKTSSMWCEEYGSEMNELLKQQSFRRPNNHTEGVIYRFTRKDDSFMTFYSRSNPREVDNNRKLEHYFKIGTEN
uniref:F-box domain-containing protein n=1 Tax=Acrobeloides nanus TaxID=290746 RepID=A0A914E2V7_9BILA